MAFNKAVAWVNLAWNFGRHVVVRMPARAFGRDSGAARFRDAVQPEGYVPLSAHERAAIPDFMQCIHCGLCSLACPDMRAHPASAWDEAWSFVAGPSRSIDRSIEVAAHIPACADCSECADVCPTGVPIPLMAAALRRLAASVPGGPDSAASDSISTAASDSFSRAAPASEA